MSIGNKLTAVILGVIVVLLTLAVPGQSQAQAEPGVLKVTLTVNAVSMTKPQTIREDPLCD